MTTAILVDAFVGLAPAIGFLLALRFLDSYALVSLKAVVALVLAGVAVAFGCAWANGAILGATGMPVATYSRYLAPLLEETAKALVVVALLRTHRIGFLVDAAIAGFALGTGFAIVENLWYQRLMPDAGLGTWIVRGFGTALMHGGTTAIFAMASLAAVERAGRATLLAFLPGLAIATLLHAGYNHLGGHPRTAMLVVMVVLPLTMGVVYRLSERALGNWLGAGFDADAAMVAAIGSGEFSDSPAGRYLDTVRHRFAGPVAADLLCYLRLAKELALRAKGLLLMREAGFEAEPDEDTRAKLVELEYLEGSIGRTGLLAVRPLLATSHRDLWQLRLLGK
jgi:RsiW-degrading membrane proteinase PrsW (M82 family)